MFKAGDVFVVKLPYWYYGAIRILKVAPLEHTEKELKTFPFAVDSEEEYYLVAPTKYFGKEAPHLTSPGLGEILERPYGAGPEGPYLVSVKLQEKKLKDCFEYLGNLASSKGETELKMKIRKTDYTDGEHGEGYAIIHYPFIDIGYGRTMFIFLAHGDAASAWGKERMRSYDKAKPEMYRYKDNESDKYFVIRPYGSDSCWWYLDWESGQTGSGYGFKAGNETFYTKEERDKRHQELATSKTQEGYKLRTSYYRDRDGNVHFDKKAKKTVSAAVVKHEAYRYAEGKSDKFWRVEYTDNALVINYGKTGTTGTYQIKEFDSSAACNKEVQKLTAAKVKKGYKSYPEFDADNHLYIDYEEIGPHILTSHPKFRKHFTDELYYDCTEEAAPFGSDEGADTLSIIEEYVRKDKAFNFTASPKEQVEIDGGCAYCPPTDISRETTERLLKEDEMCLTQSDMVTYATAFAQIKITGRIDAELKKAAINAMKRKLITDEILGYDYAVEILPIMIKNLTRFAAT